MIKQNELRLGNWAKWPNEKEPNEVQWEMGHWLGVSEGNYQMPEPIPLTEDWLLRAGFEKSETYDFGCSLKVPLYKKFDFSIMLSEKKYYYTIKVWDGGCGQENEPIKEIEFLHQLQNLFYCLSGEELTFKN